MADINLTDFGFDGVTVSLIGSVIDQHNGGGPLIFLNEEDHKDNAGIADSLRNSCKLVDDGIVDFIGVEGYPSGVVESLLSVFGNQLTWQQVKASVAGKGDEEIIATLNGKTLLYATSMKLLRPDANVVSIEDATLYEAARKAKAGAPFEIVAKGSIRMLTLAKERGIALGDMAAREALRSEVFGQIDAQIKAHLEETVERPRNAPFVANLFVKRQELHATGASLMNIGRMHFDDISQILKARGDCSFIRISPLGG